MDESYYIGHTENLAKRPIKPFDKLRANAFECSI